MYTYSPTVNRMELYNILNHFTVQELQSMIMTLIILAVDVWIIVWQEPFWCVPE